MLLSLKQKHLSVPRRLWEPAVCTADEQGQWANCRTYWRRWTLRERQSRLNWMLMMLWSQEEDGERERGRRKEGGSIEIRCKAKFIQHENIFAQFLNPSIHCLCISALKLCIYQVKKGCVFLELRSTSLEVVQFQQKLSVCVFLGSRSVQCSGQETGSVGAQTLSVFRS